MAKRTTIGGDLDIWGVRKIYVLLLHRMVGAARLRLEAGHSLLLSDYKILLRCAGAASDPTSAYFIWRMMDKQGQAHTRDSSTYHEFIKARFLTDELYTQYDLARFRVRPIDLNRQKLRILSHRKLTNLRALERNMLAIRRYRFGQNRHELDKVEHLMRIFRKVRPLKKLFAVVTDGKYPIDEGLLCSFIVAFARSGSLNFIEKNILAPFWGIRLNRFKSGEVTITYTPMPPLGQLIKPTERLLDAVLTSYCSNAEVAAALKLADFISRSYGIPIPERMWFKLLQLAHVQTSKPCCIEWRITGLKYKMVHPKSVEMIWNAMTSPPYNVRPGFAEHRIMITWLLANRRIKEAIALLLELESSYKTLLGELEGAYQRYVLAVELGAGVAKAKKAWLDTHVRKVAMAYEFEVMLYRLLKRVRRNRWLDDDFTARLIPQLVDAFRSLLPATVKYKTPTGTVQIHSFRPVGVTHMARVELDQPAQVTGDIRRPYIRRRSPVPAKTASTRAMPSALNRGRPDRSRFAALIRRVTFRRAVAWRMDPAALHRKESTVDLLRVFT
ncbi:hypothetical protein QBC46DRAFT_375003 [Diplogelasinospora grovesii]|uniref:Uncharacterized protein n=1 Tax=Diplogelasinospora grovesii TaxID=303347 RepID=A0AAN6S8F4_9PEZI|nr:hypothetical protein QBC46DRAFT_375003 [Diplogelasinospora grovesii]